jgi:uncharacterized lipoprotein
MSRTSTVFCLLLAVLLGSGCRMFERREEVYKESRSHPPLQVPEDLDRPQMDDALYIPELPAVAGTRRYGGEVPATPAGSQLAEDSLFVADTLPSTWRRARLALDRIPEASILEADEVAGKATVQAVATRPVTGFFRRLVRREEKVVETFELRFEAEGAGTRIRTVGGGQVARAVLQRLKERLG